ncbi:MAG: putative DNA-binding transcriptional regulator [Saprospiraceae bacterium]|jgi:predicted DNA-binding transcriptional regulator|tara:strand:- start:436 stop:651 length:216 start_codon:yes stop_codon:yes gene_type:complete
MNELNRSEKLVKKLETKIITEAENQVFLKLVEQDENLRNKRVAYRIELSELQEVPFTKVREKFAFKIAVLH